MATTNKKPSMYDLSTYFAAGINPTTGLPLKADAGLTSTIKENIKQQLQVLDEQNAINRYTWYGLPPELNGQLIERILYYKGQGMFFYIDELGKFFFLPYALNGTIDVYGRYKGVNPLPYGSGTTDYNTDESHPKSWVEELVRYPLYELQLETPTPDIFKNGCVLLQDYSKGVSETITPRCELNRELISTMADCIPFMRTALLNSTGVSGLRVSNEDEKAEAAMAGLCVEQAALNGQIYIPMVGLAEFQDLGQKAPAMAAEFMQAMQSLDNYRLGLYGLENGGLFQKKAQVLTSETSINGGSASPSVGLVNQDGLTLRQNFCDIVNSVWGLGIECDVSENVTGMDMNLDGRVGDDTHNPNRPVEENGNDDTLSE